MPTENFNQQVVEMYRNGDSTHTIAKALNTYPNKIKRILEKCGEPLRDKKAAHKIAAQTGRYQHPTQGKHHSNEVKNRISKNVHKQWADSDDTEKEARKKKAKANWKKMPAEQKEEFLNKAHQAIRKAADVGSKMELFLADYLINEGYYIIHHSKHKVGDENMEIDILIPGDKIAIEIDGPSHFEPIWGEKSLKRNQAADTKKNGILLANGFHVIRIRDKSKKITRKVELSLVKCIREAFKEVENHTKPTIIIKEVE